MLSKDQLKSEAGAQPARDGHQVGAGAAAAGGAAGGELGNAPPPATLPPPPAMLRRGDRLAAAAAAAARAPPAPVESPPPLAPPPPAAEAAPFAQSGRATRRIRSRCGSRRAGLRPRADGARQRRNPSPTRGASCLRCACAAEALRRGRGTRSSCSAAASRARLTASSSPTPTATIALASPASSAPSRAAAKRARRRCKSAGRTDPRSSASRLFTGTRMLPRYVVHELHDIPDLNRQPEHAVADGEMRAARARDGVGRAASSRDIPPSETAQLDGSWWTLDEGTAGNPLRQGGAPPPHSALRRLRGRRVKQAGPSPTRARHAARHEERRRHPR